MGYRSLQKLLLLISYPHDLSRPMVQNTNQSLTVTDFYPLSVYEGRKIFLTENGKVLFVPETIIILIVLTGLISPAPSYKVNMNSAA